MVYSNIESKMTPSMISEGGGVFNTPRCSHRIQYAVGGRVKENLTLLCLCQFQPSSMAQHMFCQSQDKYNYYPILLLLKGLLDAIASQEIPYIQVTYLLTEFNKSSGLGFQTF